jgi:hypothetical protein
MALMAVKDSAYLIQNIVHRLGIHSYDVLLSYIMYTKLLSSSPFLYSYSIGMSGSSYLLSDLLQMDLYVYIDFPLTAMMRTEPQPESRICVASGDM